LAFLRGSFQIRSEAQALTYIHPANAGLPTSSSPRFQRPCLGSVSEGRLGTAKCPEPLCCMPALPSYRRRLASPRGTLLPLHRSYGLMRQTAALLPPLTKSPAAGLCRLLSAPAAQRSFPTLSLPILPCVSGPLLRLLPGCTCPLLPPRQWPSPSGDRVGAIATPPTATSVGLQISKLQSFTNVQTHKFARHPGSSHPCVLRRRAAVAYTSAHITVRCLSVQRICLPPKSGQLTVRGLSPLKIGSLVGCSLHQL
jgi:hypothetical protein